MLVHGEQNEMSRLKAALIREYEDDPEYNIDIHNPRNTTPVAFHFRGEKMAKVESVFVIWRVWHVLLSAIVANKAGFPTGCGRTGIRETAGGKCSVRRPREEKFQLSHHASSWFAKWVTGIPLLFLTRWLCTLLIGCNKVLTLKLFSFSDYTDLAMSTITQRQSIAYTGTFPLLRYYLMQLSGDVEEYDVGEKQALRVFKAVNVVFEGRMVTLEVGLFGRTHLKWNEKEIWLFSLFLLQFFSL